MATPDPSAPVHRARRPTALAWLAIAAPLGACVAPGSGQTDMPTLALPTPCGTTTPSCISSCNEREELGPAVCDEGIFRCARGIREDLCCDPIENPERCPEWGAICRASAPCAEGYTCVTSRSWPLPDVDGVCRLGDWSIPEPLARCEPNDVLRPEVLALVGQGAVKVEGVIRVEPTCDTRRCDAKNPCCQRCTGVYALDITAPSGLMRIGVRTETLSCIGTNCGFSCAPLQPGRRYRLWGMWVPQTGATAPGSLYMAGFCAI